MPASDTLQLHLGEHFTVERELGGGGMSRVWVAVDQRLGRRVAVKVLRPELAVGVSLERFRREIRTAASLQHPLIVPVLDTGEVDGLPYFVMPFVEGESLRARLARGPLSVVDTVRILRDIARALTVAHSRGVVHRDIKPDNVLLANDAAIVADFGVAKAIANARHHTAEFAADSSSPAAPATTTEGMSLGTPAYMAPEQVAADPLASFPMDLYAVGVLAYEMLTGTPPFHGRSPQQIMAAHITELPVSVGERRADVPPALAALVMQCLLKDPTMRPASAAALVGALEDPQVISGSFEPIAAGTVAVRAGADGASRRKRLFAAVAVAALLSALAWWSGRGTTRANAVIPVPAPVVALAALPPSVAVLPFAFLGADTTQAFAAQAITEAITSALAQEPGLRVPSRAASIAMQQRLASGDTSSMAVRTLVEGVVEVQGDRVRLTVRLVDAATGFTLFADRVEGRRGDLFAMEDDVARGMRERLRAHFQIDSTDRTPD